MPIYVGSRYQDDVVDRVRVGSGDIVPTIYHRTPPRRQNFSYGRYVAAGGERMDSLAARFLGDAELYWVIANANPGLFYPDQIPTGTVLRIPSARLLG